ncbi:MAG: hypothetical protein IJ461_09425 [Clostridia bacterium]|nr:hypothetical protein [Clostridia bacterium]
MMKGYDAQEALTFILKGIDRKGHKALESKLDVLISQMIDFDMEFMHKTGVIDENGEGGDNYYDDDEAFEYILDAVAVKNKFNADMAMKAAALLDDFMDLQQTYMETKGLVAWE